MGLTEAEKDVASTVVSAAAKPATVKAYVDDVKVKTWTQHDWGTMLGAAPLCLELLGSCCLVSSTEIARTTKLTPPASGFKYLKGYEFLSSCLVEVTNQGSKSFMLARSKMASIGQNSKSVKRNVINVLKALRCEEFDDIVLETELETLKGVATRCVEDSKAMDETFTNWLYFIMELHEACQDEESRDAQLFRDIVSKEKSQRLYQEEQEKILAEHKERVKLMEEKVKEAHDMFKKLSDEFPTGDDLMKQQLIMLAGETASSLIKLAGSAFALRANPFSALAWGKDAADKEKNEGKGKGKGKGKKKGKGKNKDDESDGSESESDDEADIDAALARCPIILKGLEVLDDILDDGVDWDRIAASTDDDDDDDDDDDKKKKKKKGKMDIVGAALLLSTAQKNMKKAKDERNSTNGKKLLKVLKSTMTVVDEMKKERTNSEDVKKWKKPADDSKIVKNWEKTVTKQLTVTKKLQAKSKASRGGASNRPHLTYDPNENEEDRIQGRKDLNEATLEGAKAHLKMALEAYIAQQEAARKMNDTTLKMQGELAGIRKEIAELGEKKISLEEVRRVLRDCIAFLIQLKDQVKKLTIFFNTVAVLISSVMDTQVTPFAKLVDRAGNRRVQGNMINENTVNVIMQYALDVAANFSLYDDISQMYININDQHILPGLKLVDEMGLLTSEDELAQKKTRLQEYSTSSMEGIGAIISKKTEEVCAGSKQRTEELKKLLDQGGLPPSKKPQDDKAIEDGAQQGRKGMEEDIDKGHGGLDYLGEPKDQRDQNKDRLGDATSPDFLEKEKERLRKEKEEQEQEDDEIDPDDDY